MTYQKKKSLTNLLIISLLFIGIVYAILTANLQINGTAKIGGNTWDIHFDNVQVNPSSVALSTGDSAATIDPNDNCKVDFIVTLSLPGDYYEFTVDVVNAGSIDGMIQTYSLSNAPDYLTYSVTYVDGTELQQYQLLRNGETETYKVKLEFKTDLDELPPAETLSTSFEVDYVQADSSGIPVRVDFATSSWADIIAAYNAGATTNLQTAMEAGTTRNVDLGTFGVHPIRIANLSKPAECSTAGFSQTACGFVLEFADVITTHRMNPYSNSANSNGDGNHGGWEYSDMRAYLNSGKYLEGQTGEIDYTTGGIFNALPDDLRNSIINTTVVSGYGPKDSANFTTTDKLFLLSSHEVWEDVDGNVNSGIDYYDKAYSYTRQLDYYAHLNVTTSDNASAGKQNNGSRTLWWLRSCRYNENYTFNYVYWGPDDYTSTNVLGVSPAFRIAS